MSLFDKVAWKDGMFLLPQHFQQGSQAPRCDADSFSWYAAASVLALSICDR